MVNLSKGKFFGQFGSIIRHKAILINKKRNKIATIPQVFI